MCIDDEDSSEVWHIFRVGRRARPSDVRAVFDERGLDASAAHTGYRHLPGRPVHRRRVTATPDGALTIVDRLEGRGEHRVRGGLLLDPSWTAEPDGPGWLLVRDGRRLQVRVEGGGVQPALDLSPAAYHPDYGVEVSTQRLTWHCAGVFPFDVRTEIREA